MLAHKRALRLLAHIDPLDVTTASGAIPTNHRAVITATVMPPTITETLSRYRHLGGEEYAKDTYTRELGLTATGEVELTATSEVEQPRVSSDAPKLSTGPYPQTYKSDEVPPMARDLYRSIDVVYFDAQEQLAEQ